MLYLQCSYIYCSFYSFRQYFYSFGRIDAGKDKLLMYELYELKDSICFGNSHKLLYVSTFKFERDWNGARHSHECTELFFCVDGRGQFSVRDDTFTITGNTFIIINPAVIHAESSSPEAPLEYMVMGISNISFLFSNLSCGYYMGDFSQMRYLLLPLLAALVSELKNKPNGYRQICSNILDLLLSYISRFSDLCHASDSSSAPKATDHNIHWIRQYIDDNFTKEVNLDMLADKIGLNKYSIIRNFHRIYGVTPINYMLDKRFEQAKFLLSTTENTVRQIAEALGFSSASYFTQCFQKREGISPTQYKALNSQKG